MMHAQSSEFIWEIAPVRWHEATDNEMSTRFYEVLLKWLPYANAQFSDNWHTRPNCGHFFGGSYWYGSETANTAAVYAVLAKLGPYREEITGIPRDVVLNKAVKGIRYLVFTHDTGPEDCVRAKGPNFKCSETKWGGKNDPFFPASQTGRSLSYLGVAAWLLWEHLDDETKTGVQNTVAWYADRWSAENPRNGAFFDTQCEENAWTAMGISTALAMFPKHPSNETWKEGFIKWSLNTATTYLDRSNSDLYKGRSLASRINCITLFPDFTTENHAFVHPSYLSAGINLRGMHAIFSLMSGQELLDSALYNNEHVYGKALKIFTQFDGLVIPIQGQDWWYNRQHERQVTHAVLNVLHQNKDAARLERNALTTIEKIQNSNAKGCLLEENGETCIIQERDFQSAKDMEHSSASDLLFSYLLHLFGGNGAEPSCDQEMQKRLSGVYRYPHGCILVHRKPDSFTSFSWRNNVMGLALPKTGLWDITAMFSSFTGHIAFTHKKGKKGLHNETNIKNVVKHNESVFHDGFAACVTVARGDDEVLQNIAFLSLPNGNTLYIEQLRIEKPCEGVNIQTGLIGIRNEHYTAAPELAPGKKTIYLNGDSGVIEKTYQGFYGGAPDLIDDFAASSYVNVAGVMGYLIKGSAGIRYVNKHEYPKWKGVEDILVLNQRGLQDFHEQAVLPPLAILTAPNQTPNETADAAKEFHMMEHTENNTVVVLDSTYLAYANFNDTAVQGTGSGCINGNAVILYQGTNRIQEGRYTWEATLPAYASGYAPALFSIRCSHASTSNVHAVALEHTLCVQNKGDAPAEFGLYDAEGAFLEQLRLAPNSACIRTF